MKREEFLARSGLKVEMLEVWLEQRWLVPEQADAGPSFTEIVFSEVDVARAHFIRDLRGDFGVNDEGIDVILHLVDQLHGLRRAFAQLKESRAAPGQA